MVFNYVIGLQKVNKDKVNINCREAIRAIIFQNNNILMVHNNKGDYKFPGGGVKKEETHEEALKREVREETGHIISNVKDKIGVIIERNIDKYDENSVFEMISNYYLCEISDNITTQKLENYESELDFKPVWISLDAVIQTNEEILNNESIDKNSWVNRETKALKALEKCFNN